MGDVRLSFRSGFATIRNAMTSLDSIARVIQQRLGAHAVAPSDAVSVRRRPVRCEVDLDQLLVGDSKRYVVDRLATETDWASITSPTPGAPRIVFFSIKAVSADRPPWPPLPGNWPQAGRRVLVLDLDLESPGLSSALLPEARRPPMESQTGLWKTSLANSDAVFGTMIASSNLSHDGEILVVPAHGADPGEYVSKLGRAWMARASQTGVREPWVKTLVTIARSS